MTEEVLRVLLSPFPSQNHRGVDREAGQETHVPHPGLRPQRRARQCQAPHRPPRDLQHRRVLGWRGQSGRQHPHPSLGRAGQEGLLRGPPTGRQLRPLQRHRGSGAHVFTQRTGRGAHRSDQSMSGLNVSLPVLYLATSFSQTLWRDVYHSQLLTWQVK